MSTGTEIEVDVQWSANDLEAVAKRAAASKLFGVTEDQAFALMMIAQSEGIHPIKALQRYHVVQGRPVMKADAMLADFLADGGTVEWISESDDRENARRFSGILDIAQTVKLFVFRWMTPKRRIFPGRMSGKTTLRTCSGLA